ncbi:hypothetical protein DDZ13_11840 [Coraliomargarita sinensis]|uniref:PEP-CTERM protein-sorting domain-containing protein n=1 Tax=Coraliomargarita sinensis TaxID=2174842 RepID=A0A317ZJ72_9BACT|nr:hypothetical protein [Coraliomargarita sinensis]PXA03381.1 hypothetical protein DDZ13_11840 [Coraliomargarita sinensis]
MKKIKQTSRSRWISLSGAFCALLLLGAQQAHAQLQGELGILDTSGINPATEEAWQVGDTYRFVFVGSEDRTAESTDITVYNDWAQGLADASALNIGSAQGVTWNIIGSTSSVDARDNTSTNPNTDGTGESIFLVDGSTLIASNYADLWDGAIDNALNLDENGNSKSPNFALTGTYIDGTTVADHGNRGSLGGDDSGVGVGQNGSELNEWIWRVNTSATADTARQMFAMSDTLTVVPEASSALFLAVVGLTMLLRRR